MDGSWTTLATMPTSSYGSEISVDSDHIYAFGGYPDNTLTQIYNKHTQQWSQGAMPAECHVNVTMSRECHVQHKIFKMQHKYYITISILSFLYEL